MLNDNTRRPILLVEDNPDDQLLTRRAFKKNSIENPLVIASDGVEALALLHAPEPLRPALIMMDLKLPRMTGHELLRSIRSDERTKRIPVVILTSSAEENDIAASYDYHANSYIRKPVDFQEFHRVVGQVGLYWLSINSVASDRPSLSIPR